MGNPVGGQAVPTQNPYMLASRGLSGAMAGTATAGAPIPGQVGVMPAMFEQGRTALTRAMEGTTGAGAMPNVSAFENPYVGGVIDRTQQDLARQQQMAMNALGQRATAARAFGGARHGLAEAALGGEFARVGGDIYAQQRAGAYESALAAAERQRAREMQAAGQTANLAGAAFDVYGGTLAAAERERARQLQAAGQAGNLAQTAFGMGQGIQQMQLQQGAMQRALQQQLIDAARAQYAGFTGAPMQALNLPLAALGAAPVPQTATQQRQPGLFDFLTSAAMIGTGRPGLFG